MALSAYAPDCQVIYPEFLDAYLTAAKKQPFEKTIVAQPMMGYADRIKGILTAFMIAAICQRNFTIYWPHKPRLETVLLPRVIDWRDGPKDAPVRKWWLKSSQAEEVKGSGDMRAWLEKHVLDQQSTVLIETNQNWIPQLIEWKDASGAPTGMTPERMFQSLFHALFQSTPDLDQAVDDLRRPFASRFIIGLQIRAGSNGLWTDPNYENDDSVTRFDEAVRQFIAENDIKSAAIYLSTDSARLKDRVRSGEFLAGLDVFQQDIVPFHVNRLRQTRAAPSDVLRETVIDHYMLSTCDYLIHGLGQFAVTAGAIGYGHGISNV